MDLTSKQRKYLRGLAHHLRPVAWVGNAGLSDALVRKVDEELEHHELVKVKFTDSAPEKAKVAAAELAERAFGALCGTIGGMVILYRPYLKKPEIKLPR